ncbi:prepilin-type N-terminal cleavage/methylation domain-containing protein [Bacillus sp. OV322]|uniref:type II secretion system protein n=1 Tax=Bacillus sp. OV322 TaxID=1882764 RepID=UPI0008EDB459|nr:prepilin-type N-terminal cleavage/methylation domain-containing protein [Bacillus sp. OV322]SFC54675.1 prepilin-type N-terminal cleavage/methylation domain-containing protein [Bacillus sp. OV322]
MKTKRILANDGFTLIELLVSLVIISIFLFTMGSVLSNSFNFSSSSDKKFDSIYIGKNTLQYYQDQNFPDIKNKVSTKETVNFTNIIPSLTESEKADLKNYNIYAEFTKYIDNPADSTDNSLPTKLILIKITVVSLEKKQKSQTFEGYIKDETTQ